MKKQNESTVTLICTNCRDTFERTTADHKRRLNKLPGNTNFFCGRRCSTIHRNSNRVGNGTHLTKYQFKPGESARLVYDQNFTWYIHRLTTDQRRDLKYTGDRLELQQTLINQWNAQQGKCAVTNVPLQLRVGAAGTCLTDNMFHVASIDRIDNALPYQRGNMQWVSVAINKARGNTPMDMFKQHLTLLLKEVA